MSEAEATAPRGWRSPWRPSPRARATAAAVLLAGLGLGTAPNELGTGIALTVGVLAWDRRATPLGLPLLAVGFAWLAAAVPHGGASALEGLGRVWPLAPLLAVPLITRDLSERHLRVLTTVGYTSAGVAVAWGAFQLWSWGAWPWERPATGPFDHHLTFGYALIPALARASWTRAAAWATLFGAGILMAGASGPVLAAAVVFAAVMTRPSWALVGGCAAALGVIGSLVDDPELFERVVLWTAGAEVFLGAPMGHGPFGARGASAVAQAALDPGFHFPLHAHDTVLHASNLAGSGLVLAGVWLWVEVWRRSHLPGRAAIAGLVVGGLTQDTLGDLEVVRALGVWALLRLPREPISPRGVEGLRSPSGPPEGIPQEDP